MASDQWVAIRIEPTVDPQVVIDALFEAGAQGVQQEGSAVVTHFPPETDVARIERSIRELDSEARIVSSPAPQVDWSEWRANVRSHQLGAVTIGPPWLAADSKTDITVSIDPAMAFGTGEHATTRGVVRLMQRLGSMPEVVADLGAGSAVLSICAARLGAKRVVAIELDGDAIGNAQENVDSNRVSDRVHIIEGDAGAILPLIAPVGLILANIISSVLLEILPLISDSLTLRGHAILSGILFDERDMMLDAIGALGFIVEAEDHEEGWWSVLLALPR